MSILCNGVAFGGGLKRSPLFLIPSIDSLVMVMVVMRLQDA